MADVIVYAVESRADTARKLLGAACQATGGTARLELYGSGSLYLRLGPRHGPPPADIVFWFGPFAAAAAAADGLLQSYQPPRLADGAPHDADWKWTTVEYSAISVTDQSITHWSELAAVPRLAIADPERSEVGLSILLASLDRARQVEGDAESGWRWWQQRAAAGLRLAEDEAGAAALVASGGATHALVLSGSGRISDLPLIPHAVALSAGSKNTEAARRLLDSMVSHAASTPVGPTALALDVDWARQQYAATRRRWAQSGFGPDLKT